MTTQYLALGGPLQARQWGSPHQYGGSHPTLRQWTPARTRQQIRCVHLSTVQVCPQKASWPYEIVRTAAQIATPVTDGALKCCQVEEDLKIDSLHMDTPLQKWRAQIIATVTPNLQDIMHINIFLTSDCYNMLHGKTLGSQTEIILKMWQCTFVYSPYNSAWIAFRWLCIVAETCHNTVQITVKVKGYADCVIYCLYIIAHHVHNVSDVGSASLVQWYHGSTASFCNQWAGNARRASHFAIHSTYNHVSSRPDIRSSYTSINLKGCH